MNLPAESIKTPGAPEREIPLWRCLSIHRNAERQGAAVLAVSEDSNCVLILFSNTDRELSGPALIIDTENKDIPGLIDSFEAVCQSSEKNPIFTMVTRAVGLGYKLTCYRKFSLPDISSDPVS